MNDSKHLDMIGPQGTNSSIQNKMFITFLNQNSYQIFNFMRTLAFVHQFIDQNKILFIRVEYSKISISCFAWSIENLW